MDILKIATAGSVDDGKSTLIGRLLFETKSITKDKIEALEKASKRKGLDFTDLSLLTDGLIAEREQGITIDVAHIYFNTPTRKYIIADTPGHVEYTRNMITGTSNCSASIILIDARNGVGEQTKRHFYLASLLQITNVIVAINKMDLVDYEEETFESIKADFNDLTKNLRKDSQQIDFVPLSSLYGQNITVKSDKMAWYEGKPLLEILEDIPVSVNKNSENEFRLPVQSVIRPKKDEFHDFRGYAGRIASGKISVGDKIKVFPSNKTSIVKEIFRGETKLESATTGQSVTITLEDDIDISRGNLVTNAGTIISESKNVTAQISWMDADPLVAGKTLLLQHGINRQKAKITNLNMVIDIHNLTEKKVIKNLELNEIGTAEIKLASPIFADSYDSNPPNGAFILIDEQSNNTVGVGFVK